LSLRYDASQVVQNLSSAPHAIPFKQYWRWKLVDIDRILDLQPGLWFWQSLQKGNLFQSYPGLLNVFWAAEDSYVFCELNFFWRVFTPKKEKKRSDLELDLPFLSRWSYKMVQYQASYRDYDSYDEQVQCCSYGAENWCECLFKPKCGLLC
jgi:hypothetical protein